GKGAMPAPAWRRPASGQSCRSSNRPGGGGSSNIRSRRFSISVVRGLSIPHRATVFASFGPAVEHVGLGVDEDALVTAAVDAGLAEVVAEAGQFFRHLFRGVSPPDP